MKKIYETEAERIDAILEYLTIIYMRTQTPTSSKIVLRTGKIKNNKDGTTSPLSLTEDVGIANSYPIQLFADLGIVKITGDDGKRSKFLLWNGDIPTVETVRILEEGRKAAKNNNNVKNNRIPAVIENLDDNVIDNFITEHPEEFTEYNPRKETLENMLSLLKLFEKNTKDGYINKTGIFITTEYNEETNKWEVVDKSVTINVDTRFTPKFRKTWGIEETHPDDANLSKYIGESPVTLDYVRKIQFIIRWDKFYAKKEVIVETLVEETQTPDGQKLIELLAYQPEQSSETQKLEEWYNLIRLENKRMQEENKRMQEENKRMQEELQKAHAENQTNMVFLGEQTENLIRVGLKLSQK